MGLENCLELSGEEGMQTSFPCSLPSP